jgi:hypothetical protein
MLDTGLNAKTSPQVTIRNPDKSDGEPKSFTFDASYDENVLQRVFYEVRAPTCLYTHSSRTPHTHTHTHTHTGVGCA